MDVLKGVISILKSDTDITDIVTGSKIFAMRRNQESELPAIVCELNGADTNEVKEKPSMLDDFIIEITAFSKNISECYDIQKKIRDAFDGFKGSVESIEVQWTRFLNVSEKVWDSPEIMSVTTNYEVTVKNEGSVNYPDGIGGPVTIVKQDDQGNDVDGNGDPVVLAPYVSTAQPDTNAIIERTEILDNDDNVIGHLQHGKSIKIEFTDLEVVQGTGQVIVRARP